MAYEMMVGLDVNDDVLYSQYREAMTPILATYGGGFRYDFKVSEILKNEEARPINRVFAIFFRDRPSMAAFFSDPEYLKTKERYFAPSVKAITVIAEYERHPG